MAEMLELLQAIAVRLRALTPLAVALGAAGFALFAGSAVGIAPASYLTPGLLAAIWGVWLFALITGFRGVTPAAAPDLSWARRQRARLARAGYALMAWVVVGTGLAALFLSYRLGVLWLDGRA